MSTNSTVQPTRSSNGMPAPDPDAIWLRPAQRRDLDAINALIARAIDCWDLPERVKRVSLPVYAYNRTDLDFLQLFVAVDGRGRIIGVTAWEPADRVDWPDGREALLLHGIYVEPDWHRRGLGTRLLDAVLRAARGEAYDGVLVKAQPAAAAFFETRGFVPLRVDNPERDYPHRYWHRLGTQ